MNTNFQMLRDLLEKYHPQERGTATVEEVMCIRHTLHLIEMSILQLRNLRDFVVMYLGKSDTPEDWDRLSAITYAIDDEIIKKGGEV